ncbi:hypothetical protein H4582DRAFT_1859573 [Lactarius indigo]|nr:hypothetical protein H4582DRAFT_1859573 [Lactarius indigo]
MVFVSSASALFLLAFLCIWVTLKCEGYITLAYPPENAACPCGEPLRTAEHIIRHCPRYLHDRIDTGILRFAIPPAPPLHPFTDLLSEKRGVGKLLKFFDQTRALSKPESGPPIPVPPEPD